MQAKNAQADSLALVPNRFGTLDMSFVRPSEAAEPAGDAPRSLPPAAPDPVMAFLRRSFAGGAVIRAEETTSSSVVACAACSECNSNEAGTTDNM